MEEKSKQDYIQWHSGFYSAIELEFKEYESVLEISKEYILNESPLKIDAVIIRKKKIV